jgi:hypothetical protein
MANANYDIYFQIVPENQFTGSKFFSFGPPRTVGVRGLQKLVNLFTKYLLTPVGTDPLDLSYGTDLPNLLGSNIAIDDAKDILLLAVDKTVKAVQAFQAGTAVADDERLASATVTEFIEVPEAPGFAAQVFIQNVLNHGLTFLLPTLTPRT